MSHNGRKYQVNWKKKIIIFGLGDPAQMALFYIDDKHYHSHDLNDELVIAFTVNKEFIKEDKFLDLPVLPFEDLEKLGYTPDEYSLFAPIIDNKLRTKIYNEGKQRGYSFYTYISPYCTYFSKSEPENCFILEDNTIQPFTKIGNNVILWSGNHIGHHSTLEDNVFVTSQVVISGHCNIKKGAYLGVNSTIRNEIIIGENCIIGMGAVVVKDCEPNKTYIGSPAKTK